MPRPITYSYIVIVPSFLLALFFISCASDSGGDFAHIDIAGRAITADNHPGFPISSSYPHAGLSCNDCHGAFDSFKTIPCTGCHTHAQTAVDPIHTGVVGYQYNSANCYACHPSGLANVVSAGNHDPIFPIGSGAVHAGLSCSNCHIDSNNRTLIDCTTCHTQTSTDPNHTAVGGYRWTTTDCLDCHHSAQVKRVSTHLPFLITQGNNRHYRQACRTCHPNSLTTKPFEATDFSIYSCAPCHDPARKSHFNRPSTTCTRSGCHADGRA